MHHGVRLAAIGCALIFSACSQPSNPEPSAAEAPPESTAQAARAEAPSLAAAEAPSPDLKPSVPAETAPPAPSAVPANANQEAPKTPPAEASPAERLAKLRGILNRRAATREQAIESIEAAVALAEKVLDDAEATDDQKADARAALVPKLAQGMSLGVAGYDAKLRSLVDELLQADPTNRLAAQGAAALFQFERLGRDAVVDGSTVDAALEYVKNFPGEPESGLRLLMTTGDMAERQGRADAALVAYRAILEIFPDHKAAARAQGTIRSIEMVGKPFPFEGVLLSGEPLDPESLKGKVVVLDFWATWCGPCVAEIPNMLRLYEEFHDQGLEIVGVSLDREKEKLEEFVEERKLPWPQTFPGDGEPIGWENPLATKYGIGSIPRLFLIDRDGNLVSTRLRGPTLEAKVRELMGSPPEASKGPESAEAGGDS